MGSVHLHLSLMTARSVACMSTRCKCTYYTLARCASPDETLAAWRAFLERPRARHQAHQPRSRRGGAAGPRPGTTCCGRCYRAEGRRLRIRELADAVVLSSTGMTRFVDRLEAAGPRAPRGRARRPPRRVRRDHQGGHRPPAPDVADLRARDRDLLRPAPWRRAPTCARRSTASRPPLSPAASREPARWRA